MQLVRTDPFRLGAARAFGMVLLLWHTQAFKAHCDAPALQLNVHVVAGCVPQGCPEWLRS